MFHVDSCGVEFVSKLHEHDCTFSKLIKRWHPQNGYVETDIFFNDLIELGYPFITKHKAMVKNTPMIMFQFLKPLDDLLLNYTDNNATISCSCTNET